MLRTDEPTNIPGAIKNNAEPGASLVRPSLFRFWLTPNRIRAADRMSFAVAKSTQVSLICVDYANTVRPYRRSLDIAAASRYRRADNSCPRRVRRRRRALSTGWRNTLGHRVRGPRAAAPSAARRGKIYNRFRASDGPRSPPGSRARGARVAAHLRLVRRDRGRASLLSPQRGFLNDA